MEKVNHRGDRLKNCSPHSNLKFDGIYKNFIEIKFSIFLISSRFANLF